jgi:hypothetical protein
VIDWYASVGQRGIVSNDLEVGLISAGIILRFQWYLDIFIHGRWERGVVLAQLIIGI